MEETVGNDDCRITCANSQSLQKILDITVNHISEFVDSAGVNNQKDEFVSHFTNVFKNTLQENIVIKGLPWVLDKTKLSSPERKDHKQNVDDMLLSQLSEKTADVAHKRKYCPEQCCRILSMKMKHELQNLKKAKVNVCSSSTLPKKENYSKKHIKKFSEFCRNFTSLQETVQKELNEKNKILEEINTASQIKTRQRDFWQNRFQQMEQRH